MRRIICLVFLLVLIVSTGCSNGQRNPSEPISSSDVPSIQSNRNSISKPEEYSLSVTKNEQSHQEIGSSKTNESEAFSNDESENRRTSPKPSQTVSFEDLQSNAVYEKAFSKISIRYFGYESLNEPKPYLKSKPIYGILYSGSRAQIGDIILFKMIIEPNNTSDSVLIIASDNLSYTVTNNIISVKIKNGGTFGSGSLTVSSKLNENISDSISFIIDSAGNPYNDFSTILSDYISYKGMRYCLVENGYTANDPSLSITNYSNAPAWDDMISKKSDDWMQKSFWLIDKYKEHSLGKVNFIVSSTEIGFCASK